MKKKKNIVIIVAIVAVVLAATVGCYFLYPTSLGKLVANDNVIIGTYMMLGMEDGIPFSKSEDINLYSDDPKLAQMKEILDRYTYHRTIETLKSQKAGKSENGDLTRWHFEIWGEDNQIKIYADKLIVNGITYRIGYSDDTAQKLISELIELLEE